MPAELLTAKQLQTILRVDRTTIYRMADAGRLPGLKVGNQWRFPRQQIEAWLQSQSGTTPLTDENGQLAARGSIVEIRHIFPLDCVQLIQDSFADMLGAMLLLMDLEGNAITQPSNPCGLDTATASSPLARRRYLDLWAKMAQEPALAPRFQVSAVGLLAARGLIWVDNQMKAMLILGGVAPDAWPPAEKDMQALASSLEIDPALLARHIHEVHRLTKDDQNRALSFVQRIADIFAHIANERMELFGRLQRIAEISQM